MKYLVIHPKDKSTDFLKAIYAGLDDVTVLSENLSTEKVTEELLKDYDTVLILGHGWQGGLYDRIAKTTVVNGMHARLLENKNVIAVFCNASDYLKIFNIKGFATGMFISEDYEAKDCNLPCTVEEIQASSEKFAIVMSSAVRKPLTEIPQYIRENYIIENNPVVKLNRQFMDIDPWEDV